MKFNEIPNLCLWKKLPYDIRLSLFVAVASFHKRKNRSGIKDICKDILCLKYYDRDTIEYPIDDITFSQFCFEILDYEQKSLKKCLYYSSYNKYFTIRYNSRIIRQKYGNTLHIYRVNKITNEIHYVNILGYNQSIDFKYHQIKQMVNKEIFIVCRTDSLVPLFRINLHTFIYYLNEKNLLINEQNLNKRIFKKYIDKYAYPNNHADNDIRYDLKIKNLKRYNTLLEDTSLDIPHYIYLFNKITLNMFTNSGNWMMSNCISEVKYKIKYMTNKNEIIRQNNCDIKISQYNNDFERYYKVLWKSAPQEIIDMLMNKITNFNEYVYENY
jgi:hypothetical protein